MTDNIDVEEKKEEEGANESRRDAMKKLGAYAFAAPVMLSLVASKKASATSPIGPPP